MPPKKKSMFAYSHEDLLKAVQAVQNGESVNGASKKFNIPQSTWHIKFLGRHRWSEDKVQHLYWASNVKIC